MLAANLLTSKMPGGVTPDGRRDAPPAKRQAGRHQRAKSTR